MKIEHFPGDLNYDWQNGKWEDCTAGINAKDTTDAIAGNIQIINTYMNEFVPNHIWNPEDPLDRNYADMKVKCKKVINDYGFML
jgi:hypothetical protein